MFLARFFDSCVEVISPRTARQRLAERRAIGLLRDYDVNQAGRRNGGWTRQGSSPDAEGRKGHVGARNAGYELVRNNKYAAAIDIHLTSHLVGDGIAPRAVHPVKRIQKAAQAELDRFFRSKVDGRRDMFGVQKLATSAMIVGGDSLIVWSPDADGPDGRCRVLEGAFLDHLKNLDETGQNRIVQGVEYDRATGDRAAYWLFDRHPGDFMGWYGQSKRYPAAHIDHIFDERRPGQSRGVSWLATVAPTLKDVADMADAKLMKEKVAACLALIISPPENGAAPGPFDETGAVGASASGGTDESQPLDTLRPGIVWRAPNGSTASVVNPPQSGEGVSVMRQELMGVAATTIPYHILTGDPSQANYSSLRALTNPFWTRVDDVQQNILVPFICQSAAERRMRRLAAKTGDRRYLDVTWKWAMPKRRTNDPIKDFTGDLMEVRAGAKSMVELLNERGHNPEEFVAEVAAWLAMTDDANLAFDSDPRRINLAGAIQPAAPFLYAGGGAQPTEGN